MTPGLLQWMQRMENPRSFSQLVMSSFWEIRAKNLWFCAARNYVASTLVHLSRRLLQADVGLWGTTGASVSKPFSSHEIKKPIL